VDSSVPTLYEWAGGEAVLVRWFQEFYARVAKHPQLAPIFAQMDAKHAEHVAAFVGEVLGGPKKYSQSHGGHPAMIRKHLHRNLDDGLRSQWMQLLLQTADDVGLPDDPEFRSALVSYLEWGSRLAVMNSQPAAAVVEEAPMPKWGWGEVKGPYKPA
jgi:hemoglobin